MENSEKDLTLKESTLLEISIEVTSELLEILKNVPQTKKNIFEVISDNQSTVKEEIKRLILKHITQLKKEGKNILLGKELIGQLIKNQLIKNGTLEIGIIDSFLENGANKSKKIEIKKTDIEELKMSILYSVINTLGDSGFEK